MTRLPFLMLLAAGLGAVQPAQAQTQGGLPVEAAVSGIRKAYTEMKARMAKSEARAAKREPAPGIVLTEIVVNRNNAPWRAVGIYRVVYRFWHEEAKGATSPRRLRFVEVSAAISARKYSQEYLFNPQGRLIFHFRRSEEPGAPPDLRVYYSAGRPIRVALGPRNSDLPKGADFDLARQAQAKAEALATLFNRVLKLPVE